jgi:hypothetical protein
MQALDAQTPARRAARPRRAAPCAAVDGSGRRAPVNDALLIRRVALRVGRTASGAARLGRCRRADVAHAGVVFAQSPGLAAVAPAIDGELTGACLRLEALLARSLRARLADTGRTAAGIRCRARRWRGRRWRRWRGRRGRRRVTGGSLRGRFRLSACDRTDDEKQARNKDSRRQHDPRAYQALPSVESSLRPTWAYRPAEGPSPHSLRVNPLLFV